MLPRVVGPCTSVALQLQSACSTGLTCIKRRGVPPKRENNLGSRGIGPDCARARRADQQGGRPFSRPTALKPEGSARGMITIGPLVARSEFTAHTIPWPCHRAIIKPFCHAPSESASNAAGGVSRRGFSTSSNSISNTRVECGLICGPKRLAPLTQMRRHKTACACRNTHTQSCPDPSLDNPPCQ